MELTKAQNQAIYNRGGNLLVSAAAGAGKTKVLVERIMSYLTDDTVDPSERCGINDLLVITFTQAAAAELKSRVKAAISERLAERPGDKFLREQVAAVNSAHISTIDAFCASVLRENSALADISPDFGVLDTSDAKVMRKSAMEDMLEAVYSRIEKTPDIQACIDEMGYGRDDKAIPAILDRVYDTMQSHPWPEEWMNRCLLDMHVAGMKDASETMWGRYILDELKDYVRHILPTVVEAQNLCDKDAALSVAYADALSSDAFRMQNILDAKTWDTMYRIVSQPWEKLKTVKRGAEYDAELQAYIKEVRGKYKKAIDGKAKSICACSSDVLADIAKTESSVKGLFELLRLFTKRYREKKAAANQLDFSDLEHLTLQLLIDETNKSRTETAGIVARRFKEVLVDEYQDTNGVQETIFSAITNGNLFMVGDPKQSIYSFRMAEPSIFINHCLRYLPVETAKKGEPRKVILRENFRSRPEILAAVNDVMRCCMSDKVGGITYTDGESLTSGIPESFSPLPESTGKAVELVAINMSGTATSSAGEDNEEEDVVAKSDVEAAYVADRIEDLLTHGSIQDDDGNLRSVTPNDIAIIMRSTRNSAIHYVRALQKKGIACKSARTASIMDTSEVATLYAFLQIIDCPQDIPLVAVMASPLIGFTAEELGTIRAYAKDAETFYAAVCAYAECNDKTKRFLDMLQTLRTASQRMRLSELFAMVVELTDAADVYGSMDNGAQRMANVQRFEEMIVNYESGGQRGLFGFLCNIESLLAQGAEFPQASGIHASEAVTIMSTHSAKGLEFPIVFLSDLSRRFNKDDLKDSVLLHPDLGIGVQVTDKELAYRYPTIARTAIAAAKTARSKSEELRILYVAMTRAKQKLVMTYCDKLGRTMQRLGEDAQAPLPPYVSGSVDNPGEWILYTALNREEAKSLRTLAGICGDESESEYLWDVRCVEASDIVSSTATLSELDASAEELEEEPDFVCEELYPPLDVEQVQRDIDYQYPNMGATNIPAKTTATDLYAEHTKKGDICIRRPQFDKASSGFTATERGIITHAFLRYADYAVCATGKKGIEQEIERLIHEKLIKPEEKDGVMVKALADFFRSAAGKELSATPEERMHREYPFQLMLPARELYDTTIEDTVYLQGIIDLYVEADDGTLIIYDYKTDSIHSEEEEEARTEHHKKQLKLYAKSLSAITGKTVSDTIIVFLRNGHARHLGATKE